jgi:hypothetical protein
VSTVASLTKERRLPPVAALATGALASVVVGGIVMASYAPRRAPLGLAGGLLGLGVVLMAVAVALLSRIKNFAWATFVTVFKWGLLAYVIEAALIEFAFVRNHTSGSSLDIVSAMLVIFGVSVPVTIAFTVARYADVERAAT